MVIDNMIKFYALLFVLSFRSGILKFSSSDKTEIGLKCKRIIDLGRCNYLKNCGYEAELLFYVKSDVTLENVALLAKPRGIS